MVVVFLGGWQRGTTAMLIISKERGCLNGSCPAAACSAGSRRWAGGPGAQGHLGMQLLNRVRKASQAAGEVLGVRMPVTAGMVVLKQ